jgi:hypothetical protein
MNRPSWMIRVPPKPLTHRVTALGRRKHRISLDVGVSRTIRVSFEEAVGERAVEDGVEDGLGVEEGDDGFGVEGGDGFDEGEEGGVEAARRRKGNPRQRLREKPVEEVKVRRRRKEQDERERR